MEYSLLQQHLDDSEAVNSPTIVTKDDRILRPPEANEIHLFKKFPALYEIGKFISALTRDRHLPHSEPDKSTLCLPIPLHEDKF
jgi:hypothetical protein